MRLLFLPLFSLSIFFFASCGSDEKPNNNDSTLASTNLMRDSIPDRQAPAIAFAPGMKVDVKTFEVTDSTGMKTGSWGYDLCVGGKKIIHQSIVPAIPGNHGFNTEQLANATGATAAKKMSETGSFPTITIEDLDSLGVVTHHFADSLEKAIANNEQQHPKVIR